MYQNKISLNHAQTNSRDKQHLPRSSGASRIRPRCETLLDQTGFPGATCGSPEDRTRRISPPTCSVIPPGIPDSRLANSVAMLCCRPRAILLQKHPGRHTNSEHDWGRVLQEIADGNGAAEQPAKKLWLGWSPRLLFGHRTHDPPCNFVPEQERCFAPEEGWDTSPPKWELRSAGQRLSLIHI